MPLPRFVPALGALIFAATPLSAQSSEQSPERIDTAPNVADIAMTPIQDLNLAKDPIPAVLIQARSAPYASGDLETCRAIGLAIWELDRVLGPDLDMRDGKKNLTVGRVAKSAVGSLIPFRSVVREVTGAANRQREFEAAILAGAVRRAYLKGLGQERNCAYPARPAVQLNLASDDPTKTDKRSKSGCENESDDS